MEFELKVFVNGAEYPTPTRAEWEQISSIAHVLFDLSEKIKVPGIAPVVNVASPVQEAKQVEASPPAIEKPIPPPVRIVQPPQKPSPSNSKVDEVVKAWKKIGRPATAGEIHDMFTSMGHTWRSQNPRDSTKRAVRENSLFVRLGQTQSGESIWGLRGLKIPDNLPFTILPFNPGKTVTDYAVDVLTEAGREMSLEELAKGMIAKGWVSVSPTERKRKDALRQTLSTKGNDRIVYKGDYLWGLKEWDNKPVETHLFDTDPPSDLDELRRREAEYINKQDSDSVRY